MNQQFSLILRILVLLVLAGNFPVQAQDKMRLSDCIQYAVANNPQVRVAQLQIADAEWRIKENKSSGLPQFSGGGNLQHFLKKPGLPAEALGFSAPPGTKLYFALSNTINFSVQANQLLFSNSYLEALRASKYYREYVQDQLLVATRNVRNQVIDAYLPALLVSENLGILDKNISNLEKLLNDTKAITKAGFSEQLDVDRLELSLSTLRSERQNLSRQLEIVLNALKFAMGKPLRDPISLEDNVDGLMQEFGTADLSSQINYMERPEYLSLLKGRDLSQVQVDIYKKNWLPTVAGFVNYQGSWQGNDKLYWIPQAIAGISINVPIWDGGGSTARKQRAVLAVQTIEVQKQQLEQALDLELENARKQFLNAQDRVQNQQKNLDLAQRIYNTTQTKYKAGVGSSFELVTAEQSLYSAQQALMQAQYDLLTAKNAIKRALGQ
ncbi:MAG: TolC family protein [Bacteroidetes bacterium]|nr:TolC family protein [Bacteroidota bacterium]